VEVVEYLEYPPVRNIVTLAGVRWLLLEWWRVTGIGGDGGIMAVERLGGDPVDSWCLILPARQLLYGRPHVLAVRPSILLRRALLCRVMSFHIRSANAPVISTRPACINLFLRRSFDLISGVM